MKTTLIRTPRRTPPRLCGSILATIVGTAALALASPIVGSQPARACGALLSTDAAANIEAQRALVVWRAENVDVHVQLKVRGQATDAMWLIPVGARPQLAVGDGQLFDALDTFTAPEIALAPGGGGGIGCGDDAVAGNTDTIDRGVSFSEGGTVGAYTYEIVEGNDAQAVIDHLTNAGFVVPAAWEPELTSYIDLKMTFVAARLTDGVSATTGALEPLVLSMPRPVKDEMLYPVALGRLSAAAIVPVRLYHLSTRRFRVVNYGSVTLDALAQQVRENGQDYAAAMDALTASAAGRLVVTEFARDLRDVDGVPAEVDALLDDGVYYLTRTTARVPKDALTDMLLSYANEAPEEDGIASLPGTGTSGGLLWLFGVIALTLVWRRQPLV